MRLLYCFQNQDNLFFVMEYMQGGDCLALISTMKRFPEYVAQHFIAQVSLAVRHLHTHGVIHRDIKPDNVMVSAQSPLPEPQCCELTPFPSFERCALTI